MASAHITRPAPIQRRDAPSERAPEPAADGPRAPVQLKRELAGKSFAEQSQLLAPGPDAASGAAPVQREEKKAGGDVSTGVGIIGAAAAGVGTGAVGAERIADLNLALLDKLPDTLIGAFQRAKISPLVQALPPGDYLQLKGTLKGAKSDAERGVLLKALAAGSSLADIAWLAGKIAGMAVDALVDQTTLGDGNHNGSGVRQQWSMSCGASTAIVMRGNYDPVYAVKLRDANGDIGMDGQGGEKQNADLAKREKGMLESARPDGSSGGVAKKMGQKGGVGRWSEDLINQQSGATGYKVTAKKDPTGDEALKIIDANVSKGIQVPCVTGAGYQHYVLVMRKQVKGGVVQYEFHDVGDGTTSWQTDKQIKDGTLTTSGGKNITAIDVPDVK